MTRIINALDPETAARVRAAISGKPVLKEAKAKKVKGPKLLLSEYSSVKDNGNLLIAQRAIAFDDRMWHNKYLPDWKKQQLVKTERDGSIGFLLHHFATWANDAERRASVRHIEFVRLGGQKLAKHDNLRTAFKYVVDGTCGVVLWGFDVFKHTAYEIGQADDRLLARGVEWTYLQEKSRAQPRGYAIQIRIHCAPPT